MNVEKLVSYFNKVGQWFSKMKAKLSNAYAMARISPGDKICIFAAESPYVAHAVRRSMTFRPRFAIAYRQRQTAASRR